MKVELSKSAGFCIGVRRAIDTVMKEASKSTVLYMLGDIVHNEIVIEQIREKGVKKIKRLGKGAGKTLLVRAHGATLATYKKAENAGYKIIDATCPMVKEIHKLAQKEEKNGRTIIILGDKNHEEVLGIKGSLSSKAVIIDPKEPLPFKKLAKIQKASIVIQSTQNLENMIKIGNKLSKVIKDLRFHDTICIPTKKRQKEARSLPVKHDAILVIGSRSSANTKRLYEISKGLNKSTYWISSLKEIKRSWFKDVKSTGVLAGASTPDTLIQEIVSFLESL